MACRPARDRRAAGDAHRRPRAGARRGRLHGRSEAAGDGARSSPALAVRARAGRADRPRTGARLTRRATPRSGRRTFRSSTRSAASKGPPSQRFAPTRTRRRAPPSPQSRSSGSSSRFCSTRMRRSPAASSSTSRASAARRLRSGACRRRRRRRGRIPHAGRAAQFDGDASGGGAVDRRYARGPHLDAVHLGHPRRGRHRHRPAARQGPRRLQLHGWWVRLEEQPRRLHLHRDRACEARAPACSLRAHPSRGEPGHRQSQRDDPAIDDRCEERRHPDRARRRLRERGRLGRLDSAD